MKGPIEEAREMIFGELCSRIRIRDIAIVQLSREHVEDEMQSLCTEALGTRRMAVTYREDEMLRLNDLLETRTVSIKLAANAVRELEENIRLHDEAAERGSEAGMRLLPMLMSIYPDYDRICPLDCT
jgi:iron only hydrogenase large subunit-like protein